MPEHISEHSDNEIAHKAAERFEWSIQVPEQRIAVEVQDRWVTLTGAVDWRYQKFAAEAVVREVEGVRGVTNLIRIRPQPYDADVREKMIDLAWTWRHRCC